MQALRYYQYGTPDVVRCEEVATPTPGADDVQVRVAAASINSYDLHFINGEPRFMRLTTGLRRPKNPRLGADVAGTVMAVGANVTQFAPGDAVFGSVSGAGNNSGFAEVVAAPARLFAHKPQTADFAQAAALPMAGVTALQAVRDHAAIGAGSDVLIYGAAGGVGTYAVQLAHHYGGRVTAVCSTRNVEQTRALGAERVIDYTREHFHADGHLYEIILGINGYRPAWEYRRALRPDGRYYMVGGSNRQIMEQLVTLPLLSRLGKQKLALMSATESQADLAALAALYDAGAVVSVIDRCFPWSEAVAALHYVAAGHARGKVVITFDRTVEP